MCVTLKPIAYISEPLFFHMLTFLKHRCPESESFLPNVSQNCDTFWPRKCITEMRYMLAQDMYHRTVIHFGKGKHILQIVVSHACIFSCLISSSLLSASTLLSSSLLSAQRTFVASLSARWLSFCVLFAWWKLKIFVWTLARFQLVDIGWYFIGAAGLICKRDLLWLEGRGTLTQSMTLEFRHCGDDQLMVWEHWVS